MVLVGVWTRPAMAKKNELVERGGTWGYDFIHKAMRYTHLGARQAARRVGQGPRWARGVCRHECAARAA